MLRPWTRMLSRGCFVDDGAAGDDEKDPEEGGGGKPQGGGKKADQQDLQAELSHLQERYSDLDRTHREVQRRVKELDNLQQLAKDDQTEFLRRMNIDPYQVAAKVLGPDLAPKKPAGDEMPEWAKKLQEEVRATRARTDETAVSKQREEARTFYEEYLETEADSLKEKYECLSSLSRKDASKLMLDRALDIWNRESVAAGPERLAMEVEKAEERRAERDIPRWQKIKKFGKYFRAQAKKPAPGVENADTAEPGKEVNPDKLPRQDRLLYNINRAIKLAEAEKRSSGD